MRKPLKLKISGYTAAWDDPERYWLRPQPIPHAAAVIISDAIRRLTGTRKRSGTVFLTDSVMPRAFWDGGSRNAWFSTRGHVPAVTAPPQFNGGQDAKEYFLQPGEIVVECGIFRGKPAFPTAYMLPATWDAINAHDPDNIDCICQRCFADSHSTDPEGV